MNSIDLKFTAIPLIFLILRIWTLILSVMYDYVQVNDKHVPEPVKITLLYLSVSIYNKCKHMHSACRSRKTVLD